MPDRNGYQTLRDKYPIWCDVCGELIEPTRYKDGRRVFEGEAYRVLGQRWSDDKIPTNVYAHLRCLGGGGQDPR